ncbi:hypothetical protein F8E02_05170 [Methanoculleus sp. Wushi-C6]|uniref:Uncharacterized protein n=1 Tax=Methanoculleus caldifontis TaxID=2651577 RepID=A0ABU3X032_9EURY|nr:hypothetical protein [Methanoculleus sp. Wushi-C6]MDV2481405.1 hypothetical protein [Methanoculleus sp. Wushi-C6]
MGLDLGRTNWFDWINLSIGWRNKKQFLKELEEHIGRPLNATEWTSSEDNSSEDELGVRIGSYSTYGIFRLCLSHVNGLLFEFVDSDFERADLSEIEAMKHFDERLRIIPNQIKYANQFLESADSDTIFIPVFFESPFEYNEFFLGSKPAAEIALEEFAKNLEFDLLSPLEEEYTPNPILHYQDMSEEFQRAWTERRVQLDRTLKGLRERTEGAETYSLLFGELELMATQYWDPIATSKNVARKFYQYFKELPLACVELR